MKYFVRVRRWPSGNLASVAARSDLFPVLDNKIVRPILLTTWLCGLRACLFLVFAGGGQEDRRRGVGEFFGDGWPGGEGRPGPGQAAVPRWLERSGCRRRTASRRCHGLVDDDQEAGSLARNSSACAAEQAGRAAEEGGRLSAAG